MLNLFLYKGKHCEKKAPTNIRYMLPSLMGLMLCMVCLVGTTYAWFTANQSAEVDSIVAAEFDVEVKVEQTYELNTISYELDIPMGNVVDEVSSVSGNALLVSDDTGVTDSFVAQSVQTEMVFQDIWESVTGEIAPNSDNGSAFSLSTGVYQISIQPTVTSSATSGWCILWFDDAGYYVDTMENGCSFGILVDDGDTVSFSVEAYWGVANEEMTPYEECGYVVDFDYTPENEETMEMESTEETQKTETATESNATESNATKSNETESEEDDVSETVPDTEGNGEPEETEIPEVDEGSEETPSTADEIPTEESTESETLPNDNSGQEPSVEPEESAPSADVESTPETNADPEVAETSTDDEGQDTAGESEPASVNNADESAEDEPSSLDATDETQ